ncbi:MAG: hypothetical protein KGR26_14380, partial [Cyanobacteria bacterium REEB65]|nr:hypothetical protein [Cyanobacteria bacterium REEB65]
TIPDISIVDLPRTFEEAPRYFRSGDLVVAVGGQIAADCCEGISLMEAPSAQELRSVRNERLVPNHRDG